MLSFIIWVFDFLYIAINIINAKNYFELAKNFDDATSMSFKNMAIACIVNIVVSIFICLAITIAYERSQSNKQTIENISEFLESKNKKKILEENKEKDKVVTTNWIVTTNNLTNKINIEKDDNLENIAKKDECPICFSHINSEDKKCSNCGHILKSN